LSRPCAPQPAASAEMNRQQEWKDSSPARHATPVDDKALTHPHKIFHQSPAFNASWCATSVDNKALQHPNKRYHQAAAFNASWSPATEFSELVTESRAHQLRKEIDPRGHLLAVLGLIDVQWRDDKTASVATSKVRKPSRLVKSGAVKNPADMLVSNPPNISLGVQGIPAGRKPPLLKSSTMRSTNSSPPQRFAGSFSSLRRPSEPSRRASVNGIFLQSTVPNASVEESPPSVSSPKPLRRGGSAPATRGPPPAM